MQDNELLDILQLINTDGIGPVTFYRYVDTYGSTSDALHYAISKKAVFSRSQAEDIVIDAERLGIKIISYKDKSYPQNLLEINDAPPIIYVRGNIDLLNYPLGIAIVGARNASINGRKIASRIAYDLTQNDVLVVSGMARGIDSAAHKGALYAKEQQGPTIAVIGTGLDIVYPPENKDLYEMICTQGVAISEFPLHTKAQTSNFPRRNRIISALTYGTLIVEAGLHSGSLITAHTALEQGKEIFAIPGSPLENRSQGPNHLIKQGAILTENAQDILNTLSIVQNQRIKTHKMVLKPLDKAENSVNIPNNCESNLITEEVSLKLEELITYNGIDIDELLRNSGLSQAEFFSQLLDLEFSGKIVRQTGNRVARIK